jgi:hypothetical protein
VSLSNFVSFAPESDSPATRACVDVLLLMGRAIEAQFPNLLDICEGNWGASPAWDELLGTLATFLFQEMRAKNITDIMHAHDVWKQFMASRTVQRLPPSGIEALGEAGKKVTIDAVRANAGVGLHILARANQEATNWIGRRIMPYLRETSLAIAPVVIDYDVAGTQFCASSSPLSGEIHWTLQPFEHSLYGAMAVSRVLEHEYVSHLLPRNQYLSNGVREVFLVETLDEEHRDEAELNPRVLHAEMKVARWFREKLDQHFQRGGQTSRAELRDFEDVAIRIRRRSPADFWKMTNEIMSLEDGEEEAGLVDRTLRLLRPRADRIVDRLTVPWQGFARSLEMAKRLGIKY